MLPVASLWVSVSASGPMLCASPTCPGHGRTAIPPPGMAPPDVPLLVAPLCWVVAAAPHAPSASVSASRQASVNPRIVPRMSYSSVLLCLAPSVVERSLACTQDAPARQKVPAAQGEGQQSLVPNPYRRFQNTRQVTPYVLA